MDIKKIEEVIKLVKSNDVKKFKYKDNKNEIELDFTEQSNNQNNSTPVIPVSYTHLTLPTTLSTCRSRWSPYH